MNKFTFDGVEYEVPLIQSIQSDDGDGRSPLFMIAEGEYEGIVFKLENFQDVASPDDPNNVSVEYDIHILNLESGSDVTPEISKIVNDFIIFLVYEQMNSE